MPLVVGAISGTSCDGLDMVLTECSAEGVKLIHTDYCAYPKSIKDCLEALIESQQISLSQYSDLDIMLADFYYQAIKAFLSRCRVNIQDVKIIGSHGQTVYHQPIGNYANTIQMGAPQYLAARSGVTVVSQFRHSDMFAGGQGAPLAPYIHRTLFYKNRPIAVVNLGGIANISGFDSDTTYGYDTGPANCLMNSWVNEKQGKPYDDCGAWACSGELNSNLLNELLQEPYFLQKTPKSTGRELFNLAWLKGKISSYSISDADVQSTLAYLTVNTVINGLDFLPYVPEQLILCGGGVHNDFLVGLFHDKFNGSVVTSDQLGYDADFIEALLVAWLSYQRIQEKHLNLMDVTGASKTALYGNIYQP